MLTMLAAPTLTLDRIFILTIVDHATSISSV
jgi:hypothetical protein